MRSTISTTSRNASVRITTRRHENTIQAIARLYRPSSAPRSSGSEKRMSIAAPVRLCPVQCPCSAKELTRERSGTHDDGYTTITELSNIVSTFMRKNDIVGLRDGMAFLLSHAMTLRGDELRRMELADLTWYVRDGGQRNDPTPLRMVAARLRQSKTNQFGKLMYSAFARAKRADLCPVGALSFYFFAR